MHPFNKKELEKGSIPWLNCEVKAKLFKRDHLKKRAIQTNNENNWKLYRSSRNDANSALRCAKKAIMQKNFQTISKILKLHGKQ